MSKVSIHNVVEAARACDRSEQYIRRLAIKHGIGRKLADGPGAWAFTTGDLKKLRRRIKHRGHPRSKVRP